MKHDVAAPHDGNVATFVVVKRHRRSNFEHTVNNERWYEAIATCGRRCMHCTKRLGSRFRWGLHR